MVDTELLQMSMRLFRRTMAGVAPEKPDGGSAPAAEGPPAEGGKLITPKTEVCVS